MTSEGVKLEISRLIYKDIYLPIYSSKYMHHRVLVQGAIFCLGLYVRIVPRGTLLRWKSPVARVMGPLYLSVYLSFCSVLNQRSSLHGWTKWEYLIWEGRKSQDVFWNKPFIQS